jgi:hypothetical protein
MGIFAIHFHDMSSLQVDLQGLTLGDDGVKLIAKSLRTMDQNIRVSGMHVVAQNITSRQKKSFRFAPFTQPQ